MTHLHLGYNDIESMPLEYIEWFYDRQLKDYLDKQQKKENSGFIG